MQVPHSHLYFAYMAAVFYFGSAMRKTHLGQDLRSLLYWSLGAIVAVVAEHLLWVYDYSFHLLLLHRN